MEEIKETVAITLETTIRDGKDLQTETVKAEASLLQTATHAMVQFKHEMEETIVDTVFIIKAGKVTLKRTGAYQLTQQFNLNRKTESHYRHPYGSFNLSTETQKIDFIPLSSSERGRLTMDYQTVLNGETKRRHTLRLIIEEEQA